MDSETLALVRAVEDGKIADNGQALSILASAVQELSAAMRPEEILRRQAEHYLAKNQNLDIGDFS